MGLFNTSSTLNPYLIPILSTLRCALSSRTLDRADFAGMPKRAIVIAITLLAFIFILGLTRKAALVNVRVSVLHVYYHSL